MDLKYKGIPSDLGNLADCTKICMGMNTLISAGMDCYQGSPQCNNQHKFRLILAMKQEAMTNICVIWHILLLLRLFCFTHGCAIVAS